MNNKNTLVLLIGLFISSVLIVLLSSSLLANDSNFGLSKLLVENAESVIKQEVLAESKDPIVQKVLYANNEIVGIVTDLSLIENMIADISKTDYEDEFPDSKLGFGEDVFIAEEISNFQYENIDDEIIDYIVDNSLLAIETNKITFSNGAVIYVNNVEDFENAKEKYLLNFVNEKEMSYIKNGEEVPYDKDSYDTTALSLEVVEESSLSKGYASKDNIYKDEREITEFLSYGYGTDKEYYTVKEFDTVEGVASLAGISTQQLLTINPNIKSADQLIKVGDKLNVTFFDSPVNVIVKKRVVTDEVIYPASTKYVNDPSLREGLTVTTVNEEAGLKKVAYEETYVNGQLKDGAIVMESQVLKEPVQEVVKRGTMVMPSVGSGRFRYPVDNARVTCGWYCYGGHTATDVINSLNRYGVVRAADRGVVEVASYHGINGYYVWINHRNGYKTYYGHMNTNPYVRVGQTVERGEVIGQIGMTGVATGPHVHFMVTLNGSYLNPATVLGR